jgi:hypothetical protein
MRKLELDFQRGAGTRPLGWLLLGAGLATAAGVLLAGAHLHQETQAQAARLARVQRAGGAALNPAEAAEDPAVAAARQVLLRARLPWDTLFAALEATDRSDVALLSVTPDVARRQVKLQAEARNLGSMLKFHRELQRNPAFGQVVLVDHTIGKDGAAAPVRFRLLANWGSNNAAR